MKRVAFFAFSVGLLVNLAPLAGAAGDIVRGLDQFHFDYRVKLPELSAPAQLWLPLARSDAYQTVKLERIDSAIQSRKITDASGENDLLYLAPQPSDSGKTIAVAYTVERREKESFADGRDPKAFLQPDKLVPNTPVFRAIATGAVDAQADELAKGRALYDHVLGRMKYDKSGTGWGRGDAMYACDVRTGNCTDFHSYFIALARSIGIPARFAIGFSIPADRDAGTIAGYHCWAEFYADGKWVPVDISEASQHPQLAEYYFGHHPANRFEFTRGRDLVVDPAPASGPINFLVYPLLEVAGKPVKAETEFAFQRTTPAN